MCKIFVKFYKGDFRENIEIDDNTWYRAKIELVSDLMVLTIYADNDTEILLYDSIDSLLDSWDIKYER